MDMALSDISCDTMCGPADPAAFSLMLHKLLITGATLLSLAALQAMTRQISLEGAVRTGERAQPVDAW